MYLMAIMHLEKLNCEIKAEVWKKDRFSITVTILYVTTLLFACILKTANIVVTECRHLLIDQLF